MASLIHHITQVSSALYGVNVLEVRPPSGVRGTGTSVIAIVGDFPWGPVDTVTTVQTAGEFFDTFAPLIFDNLDDYPALKAMLNKPFPPGFKVARISPSAQAAATFDFQDADPKDSVTVTAKYPGAAGNLIRVAWSVNADAATSRDATVTIGTTYSVTYPAVASMSGSTLVVTDPGDPYVTFSKASGADEAPAAISATALASGSDGTAAAGDYTGAVDLFADASIGFNVGFVAEPPTSLIDDINTGLKSFQDSNSKGIWVMATPSAQAAATAITYPSSYRSDRLLYPWPRVRTVNQFDPNRAPTTVQGSSFAAVALASVPPENSPGGAPGAEYLRGILGLEQGVTATIAQLNAMNAGGASPFFMSDAFEGAILHNALLTTLTAGKTKVFRRRMTDFLTSSIAAFLERYTGEKLDIDLPNQTLGPVTGPEIGQIRAFLEGLKGAFRIKLWELDPFSGNTQANIDDGQWVILLAAKLYSAQEQIILKATIGETVQIEEG